MLNNPCSEIALGGFAHCVITPAPQRLFKVGDKVIFQIRGKGKPHICEIIRVTNQQSFPYHLKIGNSSTNNLARESELILWTPLMEALL